MATIICQEGSDAHKPAFQKNQLLNNIVDGMARTQNSRDRQLAMMQASTKSPTLYLPVLLMA